MNIKRLPQTGIPAISSAFIEGSNTLRFDLDRQQYLAGIIIKFLGRLAIGSVAGAAVNAEAPFNLVNRIRVNMNHQLYGSKSPINLSGASLFRRAHILSGTQPIAAGSPDVAVGNYDIEIDYPVMFFLEKAASQATMATLLSAPLCSSLNVELDFNPGAALITKGATTTYTWTAYGSAAGSPQVYCTLLQANGLQSNPKTLLLTKTDQLASLANGIGQDQQVGNELPVGYTIARLWLKQFAQDTLQSSYVAASMASPKSATAAGLVSPQLQKNRVAIRQYQLWAQLESENKNHFNLEAWPSGYGVLDFLEGSHYGSPVGSAMDLLYTQSIAVKKGTLTIAGLTNALANGQLEIGVDQLYPIPGKAA